MISPVSAPNPLASTERTTSRVPQKTLGQDDFLKLLARQFELQDPMKPMEDTAFIAQMAQFSALEQSSAMAGELAALRLDQQWSIVNGYLGQQVTVAGDTEETDSGIVSAIDASGSSPQVIVNGRAYPLSAVLRIEPRAATPPAAPPVATDGS